jgi:hypothetical protein
LTSDENDDEDDTLPDLISTHETSWLYTQWPYPPSYVSLPQSINKKEWSVLYNVCHKEVYSILHNLRFSWHRSTCT